MGKVLATKVPVMKKTRPYEAWKKELQVWKASNTVLGVEKKIQAATLFESLKGIPKQLVLSELDVSQIIADDGLQNIIDILDSVYMPNVVQTSYSAINDLFTYKCEKKVSIENFIMEFQIKVNKIKALGMILPDKVLGYTLMICANLSEEKLSLLKATCDDLSYKCVKNQLIKVGLGNSNINASSTNSLNTSEVKVEDCFYNSSFVDKYYDNSRMRNKGERYNMPSYKKPCTKSFSSQMSDCVHAPMNKNNFLVNQKEKWKNHKESKLGITLFINSNCEQLSSLVGETLGHAVVDTGSPYTVVGKTWFESYVNSLSRRDRSFLRLKKSNKRFCFGDGDYHYSEYHTTVPIYIQKHKFYLAVDVISANIPLLLSRSSLFRAKAQVDIGSSTINILGVTSPLITSSSGHLCVAVSRSLDTRNEESNRVISNILFNKCSTNYGTDTRDKALKLHQQFCHPTSDRLIDFIRKTGIHSLDLENAVEEVSSQCDVCFKIKRRLSQGPTIQNKTTTYSKPHKTDDADDEYLTADENDQSTESTCLEVEKECSLSEERIAVSSNHGHFSDVTSKQNFPDLSHTKSTCGRFCYNNFRTSRGSKRSKQTF